VSVPRQRSCAACCARAGGDAAARAQADLLVNVAPKKPNWDLRRDVAKKLDKLERRTQRAIVQLLQQEQRGALEAGGGPAD
jgi:coiled-coil domain-containing protein 12